MASRKEDVEIQEEIEEEEKLKTFLEKQGYYNVRFLKDGVIALYDMLYTTGVMLDLDFNGVNGGRVYYQDKDLAKDACDAMTSIYDHPMTGYSADKRAPDVIRKCHAAVL